MKDLPGVQQQADVLRLEIQNAQAEAEIKNAMIRQDERNAKIELWQDPELMILRKAIHEKGAIESLLEAQATGEYAVKFDIPPDNELPPEMRGQAPSTVRAWMSREPKYKEMIKRQVEADEAKLAARKSLLVKHPEFAGIDFFKEKKKAKVAFGDEHKVRDGKTVAVSETSESTVKVDTEPGIVSRVFAGIFGKG